MNEMICGLSIILFCRLAQRCIDTLFSIKGDRKKNFFHLFLRFPWNIFFILLCIMQKIYWPYIARHKFIRTHYHQCSVSKGCEVCIEKGFLVVKDFWLRNLFSKVFIYLGPSVYQKNLVFNMFHNLCVCMIFYPFFNYFRNK